MRREDLEHVIRAAAALTGTREIVVIGSQAILATAPEAPEALLQSMEADVYPLGAPELADVIDGAIGELSPFHERFRYYAHGVGPRTAILPAGWEDRLVRVQNDNTDQHVGLCLEAHDLAASKLAAGRPKDLSSGTPVETRHANVTVDHFLAVRSSMTTGGGPGRCARTGCASAASVSRSRSTVIAAARPAGVTLLQTTDGRSLGTGRP